MISTDSEMAFDKSNTLSLKTTTATALRELGIRGKFLNKIKGICEKPIANIILSGERQMVSPQDQEQEKEACFHPTI